MTDLTTNTNQEKSANQMWKESGSSLLFQDWLDREKLKGTFIKDTVLTEVMDDSKSILDPKPTADKSKILGIPKNAIYAAAIIIGVGLIIHHYRK